MLEAKLYELVVPVPLLVVKKATVDSIKNQPKVSTEQAIAGYHYLKANSSRRLKL